MNFFPIDLKKNLSIGSDRFLTPPLIALSFILSRFFYFPHFNYMYIGIVVKENSHENVKNKNFVEDKDIFFY